MDIVERLREIGWSLVIGKIQSERREAADEIERLRKALRKIHELGDTPDDSWKAYQICCEALGEKE